ncbi:MAG: Glutamate-1-semialdehyde 2,1-aminomutase [Syntrophorhabdaceae bacterium PtaU1.Bin034]|nr:MAG: Glutamate-1-semialdehyde 2,1-aminomutase [Syntrophorhabdaceae bacterium PtaU1.Bin034]
MQRKRSEELYEEASCFLPGGVNSPVRAFLSVRDKPFYVQRAKDSYLYDVDGNAYLDFVSSWGAIMLGHADDGLIREIQSAVADGTSFGACHPYEPALAKVIIDAFPSIEMLRLTNSGTEATMSAVRLARGASGKSGIIKFRGCYHGHVDSLLVKAGSGLATYGVPDSKGIPEDLAKHTFVADFNHIDTVWNIVREQRDIACLIIEPVMGNMGVIPPRKGFLEDIRDLCDKHGILLIFDEVITGFRIAYGGAQEMYGIGADLTCLGKIIGGGFPIGAFGGKREVMEKIAPLGDVYQAGTLAGNPVAVRAGLYTLNRLREERPYEKLRLQLERLERGVSAIAEQAGVPYRINGVTSMFTGFFNNQDVVDYDSAASSDRGLYESFFKAMLEEGIFFAPSQYEAAFLTLTYNGKAFDRTLEGYQRVFNRIKKAS